ncbi:hypothetical protein DCAR_0521041 [Daucus carota subsp. sativus]|uniref:RING-type E3 ubiquitin transferase n=1 Tax=Daucus carota subsp. sativus TaxID=79200 RepID=A0AAF1B3B1_DAUCS|nr:PREDICTED: uncharacterized protein LOC108220570 [Daucus carota subsp. sativus]WOH01656.1 hypothetical protein DCAR_0521041 [Daucus carota subsp. sativus]
MSEEIDKLRWGIGCLVGAALSYLLGEESRINAESLGRVIRVVQIKDSSLLFDTASIVLPLIVTVSGIVGSNKGLKLESSKVKAVILHETTSKCILKPCVKNEVDNRGNSVEVCSWKEEQKGSHTVKKEVPWYLDDGTSKVFVLNAESASKFWESVGRHVGSCKSQILPVRGTVVDSRQKEPDVLVKTTVTTQPLLITGTPLTVIGEAVKDRSGRIRIQQPERGPFYVSRKNIDELNDEFAGVERSLKCVSLVLSSCGIFLIGMHTFQCIKKRFFKQKSCKRCGHRINSEQRSSQLTECPLCREQANQLDRAFRG